MILSLLVTSMSSSTKLRTTLIISFQSRDDRVFDTLRELANSVVEVEEISYAMSTRRVVQVTNKSAPVIEHINVTDFSIVIYYSHL
jgi:uncharacterized ubiquitin-like protein YukD